MFVLIVKPNMEQMQRVLKKNYAHSVKENYLIPISNINQKMKRFDVLSMVDREKVIQRVENMIYGVCGCTPIEAILVAEDIIVRAEWKYKKQKERRKESWEKMKKK
jgi:hypothetical protein